MNRCVICLLILVGLSLFSAQALVESDGEIKIALSDWESSIQSMKPEPSNRNFNLLGEALIKLSRQRGDAFQEWRDRLFLSAQAKALSIPGHAEYFADLVREEQQKVKDIPPVTGKRIDYDHHRSWYINGPLRHLPSPETIKVLGEFLSDELDKPGPHRPDQDWGDAPTNAMLAGCALKHIGLRDAPDTGSLSDEEMLPLWREWWAKVKSGEQAFAFKGQEVEYRFKPDGSVTQGIRNGALRPRPGPIVAAQAQSPPSVTWPYWIGGGLVAVALAWWWANRARAKSRT